MFQHSKLAHNRRKLLVGRFSKLFIVTGEALESRYRALDLEPIMTEDCYLATLELTKTTKEDQRLYRLIVENDRGSDRRALMLRVDEPGQVNYTVYKR